MLDYVMSDCIEPTSGIQLLEVAKGKNRLDDLHQCMEDKIAQIQQAIQEEETQHKQVTGKELPPNRKVVSKRLASAVRSWLTQIRNGGPICEVGQWNFAAGIDPKAHQLHISSLTLDLENDDPKKVAKVASRLSAIAKQLPAYIRRRKALDELTGAVPVSTALDDTDMLRNEGLDDIADEIDEEARHGPQEIQGDTEGEAEAINDAGTEEDQADTASDVNDTTQANSPTPAPPAPPSPQAVTSKPAEGKGEPSARSQAQPAKPQPKKSSR